MFRYWYKDPDGELTEIVGLIRENSVQLVSNAEEGSVGSGTAPVNDPTAAFNIRGHRTFLVTETECAGDDYGGVVYVGYTWTRHNQRNIERADGSRDWGIELVDVNTLMSDRIEHGKDVKRKAETDIARVQWMLSTAEMGIVEDDDSLVGGDGADPEDMDATDLDGTTPLDIIDDCAQQSGRNYFLTWRAGSGLMPLVLLWYQRDSSTQWSSPLKISNVPTDLDYDVTWPTSFDAELVRDPSRVYSNIREDWDGGFVNEAKESTATRFRRRWTTGRAELVKTAKQARRRARRTLNDIDTELDEITCAVLLPRRLANGYMPGMRVQFRASHLQGYAADFVWLRIKDRTLTEVNPELVQVALTLTGEAPGEGPSTGEETGLVAYLDYVHQSNNEPHAWFEAPGDNPPRGWKTIPTTAPVTPLRDTSHSAQAQWYGWQVDDDFTGDIWFHSSVVGVQTFANTITWAILVNGAAIGSYTVTPGPGFRFILEFGTVEVLGYSFSAGDIIEAFINNAPAAIPFFRAPGGTGTGSEQMKITNGAL